MKRLVDVGGHRVNVDEITFVSPVVYTNRGVPADHVVIHFTSRDTLTLPMTVKEFDATLERARATEHKTDLEKT